MKQLLAYHGDPEIKKTIQEFIREALETGIIAADHATGLVYFPRPHPNKRIHADEPAGTLTKKGYLVTTVHLNGERRQVKLHQVVWISAGRQIPSGMILDHENRVKTDNRLDNLRLATPLMNSMNRRSYRGQRNPAAKITESMVSEMRALRRLLGKRGASYREIANRFGVSRSLVAQIVRGELWKS